MVTERVMTIPKMGMGWALKIYGLSAHEREAVQKKHYPDRVTEVLLNSRMAAILININSMQPFGMNKRPDKNDLPLEFVAQYLGMLAEMGFKVVTTVTMKTMEYDSSSVVWTLQK